MILYNRLEAGPQIISGETQENNRIFIGLQEEI
jgi:hypothetical protein